MDAIDFTELKHTMNCHLNCMDRTNKLDLDEQLVMCRTHNAFQVHD